MSYNIDALTNSCYEGSTCLINKFNIQDEKKLDIVELRITMAKISILQQSPINDNFDFDCGDCGGGDAKNFAQFFKNKRDGNCSGG